MWLLQCDKYHFSNSNVTEIFRSYLTRIFLFWEICVKAMLAYAAIENSQLGNSFVLLLFFIFSWESGYLFVISALVKFISFQWQWWHLKWMIFFCCTHYYVRPAIFCGFINFLTTFCWLSSDCSKDSLINNDGFFHT